MPKTHYQYSRKINWIPFIITAIFALSACIGCGIIYGKCTAADMDLSARIMYMIFWTGALFPIFFLFRHFNKSRNAKVNVITGIFFSLSTWLTSWVFYRDMEMKGIHLVELVMVCLPISIMPMLWYYCEKCRQHYFKTTVYILDAG